MPQISVKVEHLFLSNVGFVVLLKSQMDPRSLPIFIGAAEAQRAQIGWVDPADASYDQPGLLRDDYYPGDLKFDPLGIRPTDPVELDLMITRELQNGRLAMLAFAGEVAQELVNSTPLLENLSS